MTSPLRAGLPLRLLSRPFCKVGLARRRALSSPFSISPTPTTRLSKPARCSSRPFTRERPTSSTVSWLTRSPTPGCVHRRRLPPRGSAKASLTLWERYGSKNSRAARRRSNPLNPAARLSLSAEPASPGESPGQPLAQAISPVYYRTKATYVFWMLRDLAGDAALSAALRAYSTR